MPEVWVVVDAEVNAAGEIDSSPTTAAMVAALKQAIITASATVSQVKIIGKKYLQNIDAKRINSDIILYPLTLDIPHNLPFANRRLYQVCGNPIALRYLVEEKFGYRTDSGNCWLPVVLTRKGPLYAEAIASQEAVDLSLYYQPLHLSDALRQQIYQMGYRLLKFLEATPGTYLVQFGFAGKEVWFDRIWPFPAAPAIASIGVQSPDLFACHWYCLTGVPLVDLTITPKPVNR